MVLRLDRTTDGELVVMTLSGYLAVEELEELQRRVEAESARPLVVDLSDVVQVDRDAVVLLASFRAAGIVLRHCPAHILASMQRLPKASS